MKKIFLLLILLFQLSFVFGQSPYKFAPLITDNCYKGLSGSAVNMGEHNGSFSWGFRVKNNYNIAVSFECRLIVGGEEYARGSYEVVRFLKPGETYTESNSLLTALLFNTNSTNYIIQVKGVCFNKDGCYKSGYAECDNGTPNQPKTSNNANSNNNSTNQTYNSTTSTTQQNDLTEYNRTKAELEQKIQQQNAEIANKRQQYNIAINAGVEAHNSGNYADAKSQFTTAISLSNNEQERAFAQDYYNKTVKLNNDIQKINTATTTAQETLIGIDAIIKANKEKKKIENSVNKVLDTKLFENLTKDLIIEFEKIGFEYQSIDKFSEERFLKDLTKEEPTSRMRLINFAGFNVVQTFRYIENYGSNMEFSLVIKNQQIFETIKSKKPFRKFKTDLTILDRFKERDQDGIIVCKIKKYELPINSQSYDIYKTTNTILKNENITTVASKKIVEDDKYYSKAEAFLEDENVKKAIEFYKKSAALGNDKAMYELGSIYNGDEDTKNEKYEDQNESKSWYEKSANLGNTSAMEKMGACYEKGVVVEKNYATASEWYLKAIENGKAPSFINLGQLYENGGYGLEKNYAIAIRYYKKVSETTSPLAYYRIGLLYLKGGFGITKDLIKAKESFKASCDKELYYFKRDHMKSREEYNKL